MSLRTYQYIAAVSEHKSFSKAAESCYVTQPTLSAQIKKMEDKLGFALFDRTTKGVELTSVGSKILDQILAILKIDQEIGHTAKALRIEAKSSVHIGMEPGLAPFLFDSIRKISQQLDPVLRLNCHENLIDQLIEDMDKRLIDIAIVAEPDKEIEYKFTPILQERMFIGVSCFHSLSRRTRIGAEDIPLEELIPLKGQNFARLGLQAPSFDQHNTPDLGMGNTLDALKFIKDRTGCVLVPGICSQQIAAIRPDIVFIELDGERFTQKIGVISRRSYTRAAWLGSLCESITSRPMPTTQVAA